jgi:pyroglutamyl-peptidase
MILTAFDPFGGLAANPSERLLQAVAPQLADGDLTVVLPTSYARAWAAIGEVLAGRPGDEPVVLLGYSARARGLRLERGAANRCTAAAADNDGEVRAGPVDPDGPPVVATSIDVDSVVAQLERTGAPVAASSDAGGFVCNATYYRVLRHLGLRSTRRVLFAHVGDWDADPERRTAVPAALVALLDTLRR